MTKFVYSFKTRQTTKVISIPIILKFFIKYLLAFSGTKIGSERDKDPTFFLKVFFLRSLNTKIRFDLFLHNITIAKMKTKFFLEIVN